MKAERMTPEDWDQVMDTNLKGCWLVATEAARRMVAAGNFSKLAQMAVYLVTLASVRVGDVQVYNVEAAVLPQAMPFILLGNSFLSRFQMRRDNDVLQLELR